MKKLAAFLLHVVFFSCSTTEPGPTSHASLEGAWFFADKEVSGEIWISNLAGLESIDRKGYFSFETYSFAVSDNSQIRYQLNNSESIEFVYLVSSNNFGSAELYLLDGQVNGNLTEITFTSFVFIRAQALQDVFDREIVMKRK